MRKIESGQVITHAHTHTRKSQSIASRSETVRVKKQGTVNHLYTSYREDWCSHRVSAKRLMVFPGSLLEPSSRLATVRRGEEVCLGGQSKSQICGASERDFLKSHNRSAQVTRLC